MDAFVELPFGAKHIEISFHHGQRVGHQHGTVGVIGAEGHAGNTETSEHHGHPVAAPSHPMFIGLIAFFIGGDSASIQPLDDGCPFLRGKLGVEPIVGQRDGHNQLAMTQVGMESYIQMGLI